jgi:peptidoglycan/LPS O-acetylase OafA/YrhL
MWISVFMLGYFMISSPVEAQYEKGNWLPHRLSGFVSSPDDFILVYGSIFVVWAVANCQALGTIFMHPAVMYLGNISYALYLVHGTVIKSLGYVWLPVTLRIAIGTEWDIVQWENVTNMQATMAHLMGYALVGSVVLWMSDLFWRHVDIPIVKFGRWLENQLIVPESR